MNSDLVKRQSALLEILKKRDQTIPGVKERIERVKSDIDRAMKQEMPETPSPKKKKTKIVEVDD